MNCLQLSLRLSETTVFVQIQAIPQKYNLSVIGHVCVSVPFIIIALFNITRQVAGHAEIPSRIMAKILY